MWGGTERKERPPKIGKIENTGQVTAGGPGVPSPGPVPPRPVGVSLSTAQSPVSYHHATAEAAGNGSTPCIFHTAHPGVAGSDHHSLYIWGAGGGVVYVGERVKTKKVAPVTRIGTGTACANHGQRLSGSMSAEMRRYRKTLLKTTVPPNSEPGGRQLLCGLLWGLFRSRFYVRCWRHYSPLRHLSRSQDFPFTCPSRAPARPPCPHTVRTLLLRHYNLVYQRSQFHSPLHDLSPGLTVTPV